MTTKIDDLERLLHSPRKDVRLKALKLILRHPEASPLQLVQALCSADNRNGEFLDEFELGPAMRASWARLQGVDDEAIFAFLESLYRTDPAAQRAVVVHILELIGTPQTEKLLTMIYDTTPDSHRFGVLNALGKLKR